MPSKRKSCPVKRRLILDDGCFDVYDKETYHKYGTEVVRGLNKFDRKWFRENAVAVIRTGKTSLGRTFVVPYKDVDGVRYWLLNHKLKEHNQNILDKYGCNAQI
ncbi:hypothetical protein BFS06_14385 [Clostridium perfringens]|uniref:Uncharacterized protein n=1 Tax=Clostridium perfringens TaxID=1502 RepID=A0A140GRD3_CLOPF|nr:hypothetical protein [Clostridium perfringens]AMN31092.1 hypothetical protein JFP838_pA0176 [Clostridium perfringens]TBX14394.1 hypothetical protein BFS06_14385 [Clostridium perfringens]